MNSDAWTILSWSSQYVTQAKNLRKEMSKEIEVKVVKVKIEKKINKLMKNRKKNYCVYKIWMIIYSREMLINI